jgi:hypothetical protein
MFLVALAAADPALESSHARDVPQLLADLSLAFDLTIRRPAVDLEVAAVH